MRYLPQTPRDVEEMLAAIGVKGVEALFSEIPPQLRLGRPLELPAALSEAELVQEMETLAAKNATVKSHRAFLGGGAYNHFIPAVVDHLISRSEFYTAYTPYQPEISQGTLQAIFEFQTLICQLTGMDVANASMYDGASACAEAALMAARTTRRAKIVVSGALHPEYRQTLETYCRYLHLTVQTVPVAPSGATDPAALASAVDGETAAVLLGYPNFFGVIEELAPAADLTQQAGARLVAVVQEPVSLGLLKSPGELGADIVVGEGQSFGLPLSFGGPYVGFFAARQKDVRAMPGRLIGETVDLDDQRGFVLTLATREQHIRREKATSNICSNQGLCALMATVFLALLGKEGLRELASQNFSKTKYAKEALAKAPGIRLPFSGPTFNEFVIETEEGVEQLLARLEQRDILGGIPLARYFPDRPQQLLVCVTEQNRKEDIDALVAALRGDKR